MNTDPNDWRDPRTIRAYRLSVALYYLFCLPAAFGTVLWVGYAGLNNHLVSEMFGLLTLFAVIAVTFVVSMIKASGSRY